MVEIFLVLIVYFNVKVYIFYTSFNPFMFCEVFLMISTIFIIFNFIALFVDIPLLFLLRKTPEKPQPGKLSRPGIDPGPAKWETTMLLLDHSGGQI